MRLHLDFETASNKDIKFGSYRYATDASTRAHCYAITIVEDDGSRKSYSYSPEEKIPQCLLDCDKIYAWNSDFEFLIWNHVMHKLHGWPERKSSDFIDTAALSRRHGGPSALEKAARFWGLTHTKLAEGRAVMLRWRKRPDAGHIGEDYEALKRYCVQDTVLDAEMADMFDPLSDIEQAISDHNDLVNARGVGVDVPFADAAVSLVSNLKLAANRRIYQITDGAVGAVSEVAKIKKWLVSCGAEKTEPKSLRAENIAALCKKHAGTPVAEVLTLRGRYGGNAAAKYDVARNAAVDGRVHGAFRYYGAAATGRYTSHQVQLHNLVRKKPAVAPEVSVGLIKSGLKNLRLVYNDDEIFNQLSYTLRALLVPKKDHVYVAADFSSIEAKVLPWIAEQCGFDASQYLDSWADGEDGYLIQAKGMFSKESVDDVTDEERQAGKVACLACGYQGGYRALQSMASNYGLDLPDKLAQEWVQKWRWANSWAVDFWCALEAAAASVGLGKTVPVGFTKAVTMEMPYQGCLRLKSPSQGYIQYNGVRIGLEPDPAFRNSFSNNMVRLYKKGNGKPKAVGPWPEARLYAGVFAENLTQKVARDILCSTMLRCEAAGYPVVAHVHDEILLEVKREEAEKALAYLLKIMSELPDWTFGLPMGGAGDVISRYQKI